MKTSIQLHPTIHKHFHRHVHHIVHTLTHHLMTIEHTLMVVVVAIRFITNGLFAGASTKVITPTTELIYPVKKVTTLPCRQQMKLWSELDESCKIDLPIIA